MRYLLLFLMILAFAFTAEQAQAQDVQYVPVDRDLYEIRYTAYNTTDEVCFHDVVDTNSDGVFDQIADVNGDGLLDKADAIDCTTSLVADGTTINSHILDLDVGRRNADHPLAGVAYRNYEGGTLVSDISNIATLIIRPKAINLLSGEFEMGPNEDLNG
jgi:hypothetical protein